MREVKLEDWQQIKDGFIVKCEKCKTPREVRVIPPSIYIPAKCTKCGCTRATIPSKIVVERGLIVYGLMLAEMLGFKGEGDADIILEMGD